jgi:hypothetical protein
MEQGAYEEAARHWKDYTDLFGTSSFSVLFDVEQVAQGAWTLRELKDANYQRALACMEIEDFDGVREVMLPIPETYRTDLQPIKELTGRAFDLGAVAEGQERETCYQLGFDLLSAWHEISPDSYQIVSLLDERLLSCEREQRLELLRLTEHCWIPMEVAETLNREGKEFIAEAEIAMACGGTGAEAERILADFYRQAAHDQLDRLGGTVSDRRAILSAVERELLPRVTDEAAAARIRARIDEARANLRSEVARSERERAEAYSGCTELLATIQWNIARENDYYEEERDFKRGCCRFLRSNPDAWINWMRSRPENERLADAEIAKKERLMHRYCDPR